MKEISILILSAVLILAYCYGFPSRKPIITFDFSSINPPWQRSKPSIFSHIKLHQKKDSFGLEAAGENLPDEQAGISWVAGAMEGVFGHYKDVESEEADASELFKALNKVVNRPVESAVEHLYSLMNKSRALGEVDALLEKIVSTPDLVNHPVLHSLSIWLAENAPDREVVKLAIALIGVSGESSDRELLMLLGTHEEFTMFSSVALVHSSPNAETDLWELAKSVSGWGRINLVERLAATENKAIKHWMLREGYKNSVMLEYTAFICATSGDLLQAICQSDVDDDLLMGAGRIIDALIEGQHGSEEDIQDYQDAPKVIRCLLGHLENEDDLKISQLLVVQTIKEYLEGKDGRNVEADDGKGWSVELREDLLNKCDAIIDRPEWSLKVTQSLNSDDDVEFRNAARAAKIYGIETWERHFSRVQTGKDHWYELIETDDAERVGRVVELARRLLPLGEIATGVSHELIGLGPGYEHHTALGFVLQGLKRFPGKGWDLINAGLESRVVWNRNVSLNAIAAWGRSHWQDDTETRLKNLLLVEPNEGTRDLIREILERRN